ncbi:MAG: 2-C-methyl-D-erythritol 4-phosphate cytidylyltransferase [Lachnospiraceae bacterium]|nr:2-C-methyl-D-erythritol 4-phosphate cytidylyltransferase [Lachnospiraceae bacterium]
MNIALIFAGGTGKRMHSGGVPKQFLELYGKPIIIYTLEKFENHDDIDSIVISCLESYIPRMEKLCKKFHITKVAAIVPGGATGQESIANGLHRAAELYPVDSLILVHDGVRPLVDMDTITRNIECAQQNGNAVTVTPATETVIAGSHDGCVGEILERSTCEMAKAPQTFVLGDLLGAHEKASAEDKKDFIDSASLMRYYGAELHTVQGSTENIKITTPVDYYIFKAIITAKESSNAFGL